MRRRRPWPAAARRRDTAEPTKPVAPVTKVVMGSPLLCSYEDPSHGRWPEQQDLCCTRSPLRLRPCWSLSPARDTANSGSRPVPTGAERLVRCGAAGAVHHEQGRQGHSIGPEILGADFLAHLEVALHGYIIFHNQVVCNGYVTVKLDVRGL